MLWRMRGANVPKKNGLTKRSEHLHSFELETEAALIARFHPERHEYEETE